MTDNITDTIPDKIPKLFDSIEQGNVYAEFILETTELNGENVRLKLVAEVVEDEIQTAVIHPRQIDTIVSELGEIDKP